MSEHEHHFTDLKSIRSLRGWAEGVKAGQGLTTLSTAMNTTLDLLDFIEKQNAVIEAARALAVSVNHRKELDDKYSTDFLETDDFKNADQTMFAAYEALQAAMAALDGSECQGAQAEGGGE